ncbi:hypothetical protein C5L39_05800 [Corynebacterium alimapuense]|uniref:YdbS-like PH domain-containing protein n=2 Tax=Corynebacterium alimapuense TaxID=1576874 RepID=A0A3M8K959_9CORY|nr:hypothetical protein C5L39_05800 [Corynebacterium alimapuense]
MIAVAAVNLDLNTMGIFWGWFSAGQIVPILLGLLTFVVLCALVWLFSQVWWKAIGYRLTDEEISMKHGVLSTRLRTARYDRIQAVDVVESVIARVFRLAAVRVETAGGNDSVIEIAYLPRDKAQQLRVEVLNRAQGIGKSDAQPEDSTGDAPVNPYAVAHVGAAEQDAGRGVGQVVGQGVGEGTEIIPEIPIMRSVASSSLQGASVVGAVVMIGLLLTPLTWAMALPALIGILPTLWNLIDRSWRFTASLHEDTLNLSYGLADRRGQSIPLSRIHGASIQQPILWRMFGWWMVKVSVAGYGIAAGSSSGTTQVLPVGSREQAVRMLALVSPLDQAAIEDLARPEGASAPTFSSPRSARWVSPIDYRQQAVTLLDDAVVVHQGRFARRVKIIPPAHIQELTLSHGPLQQLLGLCTVRFDLVPGPVRMAGEDLALAEGKALLDALRQRHLPDYSPPTKPN